MTKERHPDPRMLQQRWMRDFTSAGLTYVPAAMAAPSRMREGFELRDDGSFMRIGAGPTDADTETPGTWELDDEGVITLAAGDGSPTRRLRVVDVDAESLTVEEEPEA